MLALPLQSSPGLRSLRRFRFRRRRLTASSVASRLATIGKPAFVLGVEGDLDAASLQGNAPCLVVLNCTMKHNWMADITGRVGVVTVERTLVYLKGGVAWEGSNFSAGNTVSVGGTTLQVNASGSCTQTGGLLGMGIEYAFLPNWSAKIEYNFIDFGTRSFNAPISTNPSLAGTPLAGITSIPFSITESEHIVKAGVNYRFW